MKLSKDSGIVALATAIVMISVCYLIASLIIGLLSSFNLI